MALYDRIRKTADFIESNITRTPEVGIILGSGLGGLVQSVAIETEIPYKLIPQFPASTVEGHAGRMIFGTIGTRSVMMMSGRFHYYEGYSMDEVTFPVRVMRAMGVHTLMVSNAAGGMNPEYRVGDIVLIRDHINLVPEHPLRGHNDSRLGPRFPDMSQPYSLKLIEKAQKIAAQQHLDVKTGVYAGVQGPTFETRAEYQWFHRIGADLVGMSTVPEVIVAVHGGMQVFGASIVTDLGIRDEQNTITHADVLTAANAAAPRLSALVAELVRTL